MRVVQKYLEGVTPLEKKTNAVRGLRLLTAVYPVRELKRHRGNSLTGFTFVEMMVVLALFSILAICLYSSIAMGFKVWKRSASLNMVQRRAILNLERLSTELRRTANYSSIGFFGNGESVIFANIYRDRIFNISYNYSRGDEAVYRSASTLQALLDSEEAPARKLISDVENFSLSYYGYDKQKINLTFFESWNYTESGFPKAVKVSLTLKDGKIFEKIIAIPISQ